MGISLSSLFLLEIFLQAVIAAEVLYWVASLCHDSLELLGRDDILHAVPIFGTQILKHMIRHVENMLLLLGT